MSFDAKRVAEKAGAALFEYCRDWDLHAVVTGVSGGLDSAVTIGLAQMACRLAESTGYELKSIGLLLPCETDPAHELRAKEAIGRFGAIELRIDLTNLFLQQLEPMSRIVDMELERLGLLLRRPHPSQTPSPPSEELPLERGSKEEELFRGGNLVSPSSVGEKLSRRLVLGNLKARLRMALGTYYVANRVGGLVLSTDNLSEYLTGFWTLHGDVGDFGMIQHLWKGTEVQALGEYLGVPQSILDAAPDDGLGISKGGDKEQLGAEYPVVDDILKGLIAEGFDVNPLRPPQSREAGQLPLKRGSTLEGLISELPRIKGYDSVLVRKIAERSLRSSFKRKGPRNLTRGELGLGEWVVGSG